MKTATGWASAFRLQAAILGRRWSAVSIVAPPSRLPTSPKQRPRMSILVNKDTKVLVQGLTGKTGTFHTEQALAYYGTQMVGGIHPKKGGETWTGAKGESLPIFATVAEGKEK
ncbi:succinate--CoA ligase subunit alpha, partial [Rhizobium phaseoli]